MISTAQEYLLMFEKQMNFPEEWKKTDAVKHLRVALRFVKDYASKAEQEKIEEYLKGNGWDEEKHRRMGLLGAKVLESIQSQKWTRPQEKQLSKL